MLNGKRITTMDDIRAMSSSDLQAAIYANHSQRLAMFIELDRRFMGWSK